MKKELKEELLRDTKVREEIYRHLWIESERLGCDVGFDTAAEDWLKHFSKAWIDYYMPKRSSKFKPESLIKKILSSNPSKA
ncbi:MAG: hypothetical protein P9X22_01680 [Candidatus Zapsychrus exili]|nr:hypothetical protein [Candidatus Zapsychrus exili]